MKCFLCCVVLIAHLSGLGAIPVENLSAKVPETPPVAMESPPHAENIVKAVAKVNLQQQPNTREAPAMPDAPAQNDSPNEVSLCVPCIPRDRQALVSLMKDVVAQTVKPKEVIIAISETSHEEKNVLEKELNDIWSPVIVNAVASSASPGENRNRAVKQAKGTVVSFMDADDSMHPQRIELLRHTYLAHHSKCMIHMCSIREQDILSQVFTASVVDVIPGDVIYKKTEQAYGGIRAERGGIYPSCGREEGEPDVKCTASGHLSCAASVFQEGIQFPSDQRGEDNIFLKSVLLKYGANPETMSFIRAPLSVYYPSDHPDNHPLNNAAGKKTS